MSHDRRDAVRGRPRHRRSASLVLAVALLVSACGSAGPTASPGVSPIASAASGTASTGPSASPVTTTPSDAAAIYATIENQVMAIRGLTQKSPVQPTVLDDAGIKKLVSDSFAKDNPKEVMDANERILKAFGLLPADANLTQLYVSLLGSQVAGLYNPDNKKLYVVSKSGALGAIEKTTFSHEFTHALQDQNFNLSTLKLDEIGQGDRSFGRLALVEGDATLSMSLWQIQNLSQAELGQLLTAGSDDASTKILLGMPAILREALLFPYTWGLSFVQGLQTSGGWSAVNAAFAKPPASSEQILHPEKFASGEQPIPVALPTDLATKLGSGWKVALEDTFGEFQIATWLRSDTALGAAKANDAAAGWGGDRIALVEGPGGAWSVILKTAWDTPADATAFEAAAKPTVAGLASPGSVLPGAGGSERWVLIASDAATLTRVSGVLGLAG